MSDETEDNRPGVAKGPKRVSLVERAAKRIVVDDARPLPQREALQAGDEATGEMRDPGLIARHDHGMPQESAENGYGRMPTRGLPPIDDHHGAASHPPRRESRLVKLDYAKLASRNVLTPQSKRTRLVEEFRLIKRRVLSRRWAQDGSFGNTIMVTSALPEEGKTTISVNLAMSIAAEEDVRVLLVDADFIKPDALRQLGVSSEKGLIDVLQDPHMDVSDIMLRTDTDKLTLIPSGKLHDRCTELLASARMSEIISELATRYEDRILIFDSPPVLATTESVALASHMGQIVFVVQAERTRRQLVDSALELIGGRDNVGLVLNRATPKIGGATFGYYYNSNYGKNGEDNNATP